MISDIPPDYYFITEYVDRQRNILLRDVYVEDGHVFSFDGHMWTTAFRLSHDQVDRAKTGIRASGLFSMIDLSAEGIADTAAYTYAWRIEKEQGQVTNWAYPALSNPVFDTVDTLLSELEIAAKHSLE